MNETCHIKTEYPINVLGKEILVSVCDTGNGLSITIFGGDYGHIGAVSFKHPDSDIITWELPNHRDGVVSGTWALFLSNKYNIPVVVSAGIHYENITKEGIQAVLSALDELLKKI